jgi:hypothetical protein
MTLTQAGGAGARRHPDGIYAHVWVYVQGELLQLMAHFVTPSVRRPTKVPV